MSTLSKAKKESLKDKFPAVTLGSARMVSMKDELRAEEERARKLAEATSERKVEVGKKKRKVTK